MPEPAAGSMPLPSAPGLPESTASESAAKMMSITRTAVAKRTPTAAYFSGLITVPRGMVSAAAAPGRG